MKEPLFLTLAEVTEIHAAQVERYGGKAGTRDVGLLESAVAMPQAAFDGRYLHPDLFAMAAAYAFHRAENQPFVDGNKRAALACALVFLELNGWTVEDPKGRLYDAMMAIAAGKLGKDGLAELLCELSARR